MMILFLSTTEYAVVTKMVGDRRFTAACCDGVTRLCRIPGRMHKREWICQGDLALVAVRQFQTSRADVILKYSAEEKESLISCGEVPEHGKYTCARAYAHN